MFPRHCSNPGGEDISLCASARLPQDGFLFSVSIISGLVCIILAVIKFMLGKVLTSRALITDGGCTHMLKHSRPADKTVIVRGF